MTWDPPEHRKAFEDWCPGNALEDSPKFHFNTRRCTAQLIMLTLENISSYKSALHRGVERWPMGNYSGLLNLYCYGRITQSTGQEILQQLCRCVALHKLTFEQFIQSTSRASTTIFRCDIFYMDILRFTMVFWEAQLHTKYTLTLHTLFNTSTTNYNYKDAWLSLKVKPCWLTLEHWPRRRITQIETDHVIRRSPSPKKLSCTWNILDLFRKSIKS